MQLIKNLTSQLDGSLKMPASQGVEYILTFKGEISNDTGN
jgi:two-component sensor histidine kinase